jgi:D-aspartate ligase
MIEIIGCTTVKNSAIIIPAIIKKIREYPLNAGSTSYAMAVTDSEYIDRTKILNLIEKTQFKGIFDIEFKYANGKIYFIEINFRNGAPGYALSKIGVNIPYLWYLEAIGVNIDNMQKKINQDYYFMVETSDIRHMLNMDLKLITWIKDLFRTNAFLFVNLRDIKPVLFRLFKG